MKTRTLLAQSMAALFSFLLIPQNSYSGVLDRQEVKWGSGSNARTASEFRKENNRSLSGSVPELNSQQAIKAHLSETLDAKSSVEAQKSLVKEVNDDGKVTVRYRPTETLLAVRETKAALKSGALDSIIADAASGVSVAKDSVVQSPTNEKVQYVKEKETVRVGSFDLKANLANVTIVQDKGQKVVLAERGVVIDSGLLSRPRTDSRTPLSDINHESNVITNSQIVQVSVQNGQITIQPPSTPLTRSVAAEMKQYKTSVSLAATELTAQLAKPTGKNEGFIAAINSRRLETSVAGITPAVTQTPTTSLSANALALLQKMLNVISPTLGQDLDISRHLASR